MKSILVLLALLLLASTASAQDMPDLVQIQVSLNWVIPANWTVPQRAEWDAPLLEWLGIASRGTIKEWLGWGAMVFGVVQVVGIGWAAARTGRGTMRRTA